MMSISHFNTGSKPSELKVLNRRVVTVTHRPLKDHLCFKHNAPLSLLSLSVYNRLSALGRLTLGTQLPPLLQPLHTGESTLKPATMDADVEPLIDYELFTKKLKEIEDRFKNDVANIYRDLEREKKPPAVNHVSVDNGTNHSLSVPDDVLFKSAPVAGINVLKHFSPLSEGQLMKPDDGNFKINCNSWLWRWNDALPILTDLPKNYRASIAIRAGDDDDETECAAEVSFDAIFTPLKGQSNESDFRVLAQVRRSIMKKKIPFEELNPFIEGSEKAPKQAAAEFNVSVVEQKLLDEGLLKLDPELAFLARSEEQKTFAGAVTLARTGILTAESKPTQQDSDVPFFANKITDRRSNSFSRGNNFSSNSFSGRGGITQTFAQNASYSNPNQMTVERQRYDEVDHGIKDPRTFIPPIPSQHRNLTGRQVSSFLNHPGHEEPACFDRLQKTFNNGSTNQVNVTDATIEDDEVKRLMSQFETLKSAIEFSVGQDFKKVEPEVKLFTSGHDENTRVPTLSFILMPLGIFLLALLLIDGRFNKPTMAKKRTSDYELAGNKEYFNNSFRESSKTFLTTMGRMLINKAFQLFTIENNMKLVKAETLTMKGILQEALLYPSFASKVKTKESEVDAVLEQHRSKMEDGNMASANLNVLDKLEVKLLPLKSKVAGTRVSNRSFKTEADDEKDGKQLVSTRPHGKRFPSAIVVSTSFNESNFETDLALLLTELENKDKVVNGGEIIIFKWRILQLLFFCLVLTSQIWQTLAAFRISTRAVPVKAETLKRHPSVVLDQRWKMKTCKRQSAYVNLLDKDFLTALRQEPLILNGITNYVLLKIRESYKWNRIPNSLLKEVKAIAASRVSKERLSNITHKFFDKFYVNAIFCAIVVIVEMIRKFVTKEEGMQSTEEVTQQNLLDLSLFKNVIKPLSGKTFVIYVEDQENKDKVKRNNSLKDKKHPKAMLQEIKASVTKVLKHKIRMQTEDKNASKILKEKESKTGHFSCKSHEKAQQEGLKLKSDATVNAKATDEANKAFKEQNQRKFERSLKRWNKLNKPTAGIKNETETFSCFNFDPPSFPSVNMLESTNWLSSIQPYDGNPDVDFDEWIRRFSDVMEVRDNTLDDIGKVIQLRCFLAGPAREKLEEVIEAATNFQQVVAGLKKAFENSNSRSLASAKLGAMEKKMPHEDLDTFLKRFEKLVKQATAGLSDIVVKHKILDEFLLKLDPELAFYVRNAEPDTYQEALAVARKHETYLKIRNFQSSETTVAALQAGSANSYHRFDVNELAEQIALNLQLNEEDNEDFEDQYEDRYEENQDNFDDGNYGDAYDEYYGYENEETQNESDGYNDSSQFYDTRNCYFCGELGHIQRDCQERFIQEQKDQEYYC